MRQGITHLGRGQEQSLKQDLESLVRVGDHSPTQDLVGACNRQDDVHLLPVFEFVEEFGDATTQAPLFKPQLKRTSQAQCQEADLDVS